MEQKPVSEFWVVLILVFLGEIQVGFAGGEKYSPRRYINWGDLEVNGNGNGNWLDFRDERLNWRGVIVVDQNGRGDSFTVQGAVDLVPHFNSERIKIYILPGIYREKVVIPRTKPFISFIGDKNRAHETTITWHNKASDENEEGLQLTTYGSASVAIESDYFCASWITFENSVVAKPGDWGRQAVALRISGDRAMFYGVRFLGSQDTLLDDHGSHFFYRCFIQGSIDFIFGMARSLYQECIIHSTAKQEGAIAAHHRDSPEKDTGFSFVNCTVEGTGSVYLGRAWGNYSRIIYSYSYIHNIVKPSGWSDWNLPFRQRTAVFGEYRCRGRGANRMRRVRWSKSFSYREAKPFLGTRYIGGEQWLSL